MIDWTIVLSELVIFIVLISMVTNIKQHRHPMIWIAIVLLGLTPLMIFVPRDQITQLRLEVVILIQPMICLAILFWTNKLPIEELCRGNCEVEG
jgi:hypothetical protein